VKQRTTAAHILHASSCESKMNQDNKSTTPSETSPESVSFFQSVSRRHPKPGVERQHKKEEKKENFKRRLQTYGTVAARHVIRGQHEFYNVKKPYVVNYEHTPCYVKSTNSSGMHKHGYPRCKIQSSPATQIHNQFCHAKSRRANTSYPRFVLELLVCFFFASFSRPHPSQASRARTKRKNRYEDYKGTAHLLHATSYESKMN